MACVLLRQNLRAVLLALVAGACSRRQESAPVSIVLSAPAPPGSAAAEGDAVERCAARMKDAGIAELETRKPCPSRVGGPPGRQAGGLGLTVRVTPGGVEMATTAEHFGTGCQAGAPGPTVPRRAGAVDLALVTACARQIKQARPERAGEKGVVLSASPSTPYREMIDVMDALRGAPPEELFPEVSFAARP